MAIQVSKQSDKYSHDVRLIADVHDVYVRKTCSYEKPIKWNKSQIGWSMGMQRSVESAAVFAEMIQIAIAEASKLDELYPTGSEATNAS